MKNWIAVIIFIIIIGLWFGSGYYIYYEWDNDNRGSIGDMFGAINALFAGLAFAGIIYTIAIQRRELELQRKSIEMQTNELKLQREETARSADQLEQQRNLLNYQLSVAHVNELLKLKNKKVEHIKYKAVLNNEDMLYVGLAALREMVKRYNDQGYPQGIIDVVKEFIIVFLYTLKYIDSSELEENHKEELRKLVVMEISVIELIIIRYISNEEETAKNLMEKFEFHIKEEKSFNF